VLARDGDRFRAGGRLDRPEPAGVEHITRELPVRLAVVDDQNERIVRLRGWRSGRHGRILSPMPIRLVLAEDQYFVREGIRRLLEAREELEVAAVCDDLDSLLAAVDAHRPDVVVTDIRMPPGNGDEGIQAALQLRETHPDIGVVVLSQYATPGFVLALLEGGSERRAYLLKERVKDVEELVATIRTVADGGSVMDPKVVEALVAENARSEESPLGQLTPRERDVLREMAEGKNNAAIAASLFLTERSVEKVIHSIFLKLGLTWEPAVHKRVKAVILYLAEGA
jgi:DNA-binding NarL/FixJ family response regulator